MDGPSLTGQPLFIGYTARRRIRWRTRSTKNGTGSESEGASPSISPTPWTGGFGRNRWSCYASQRISCAGRVRPERSRRPTLAVCTHGRRLTPAPLRARSQTRRMSERRSLRCSTRSSMEKRLHPPHSPASRRRAARHRLPVPCGRAARVRSGYGGRLLLNPSDQPGPPRSTRLGSSRARMSLLFGSAETRNAAGSFSIRREIARGAGAA